MSQDLREKRKYLADKVQREHRPASTGYPVEHTDNCNMCHASWPCDAFVLAGWYNELVNGHEKAPESGGDTFRG